MTGTSLASLLVCMQISLLQQSLHCHEAEIVVVHYFLDNQYCREEKPFVLIPSKLCLQVSDAAEVFMQLFAVIQIPEQKNASHLSCKHSDASRSVHIAPYAMRRCKVGCCQHPLLSNFREILHARVLC